MDEGLIAGWYTDNSIGKVFILLCEEWRALTHASVVGRERLRYDPGVKLSTGTMFIILEISDAADTVLLFKILLGSQIKYIRVNVSYFEEDYSCQLFERVTG